PGPPAPPTARPAPAPGLRPGTPPAAAVGPPARRPRSACRSRPPGGPTPAVRRRTPARRRRSWPGLLLPEGADQPQLALDPARRPAQLGRDPLDADPLQPPQGHPRQLGVAQAGQQPLALLGHLGGQRGRRLAAQHLLQPWLPTAGRCPPAAALVAA